MWNEIRNRSPVFAVASSCSKPHKTIILRCWLHCVLWSSPRTPNVTPDLRSLVSQECTCSSPTPHPSPSLLVTHCVPIIKIVQLFFLLRSYFCVRWRCLKGLIN